jgi:methyl halide transferase
MDNQTDKAPQNDVSLDAAYWNSRYLNEETGWDLRQVSPPLKAYFDQVQNKDISILIPGCGSAHEANYLLSLGFKDITLVDISEALVGALRTKLAGTGLKVLCQDIFEHEGQYDLIVEQTLFCALDPSLRARYADKMQGLLSEQGKLVGVLFGTVFEKAGPPFGGSREEYLALFSDKFNIRKMDNCYNSVAQRQGSELFVSFSKL